jgi:hypothetical protein
MKLYGIAWRREFPCAELISAARQIASDVVTKIRQNEFHVGFVGVHDGCNAAFVFVDFWGNENELFHHLFISRNKRSENLKPAAADDSTACVWDLKLQAFERDAWVKNVLRRPDQPNFSAYLEERLNGEF